MFLFIHFTVCTVKSYIIYKKNGDHIIIIWKWQTRQNLYNDNLQFWQKLMLDFILFPYMHHVIKNC